MKLAFLFCFGLMFAAAQVQAQSEIDFRSWSESREWRRLLHMRSTWTGDRSMVQGREFFLAVEGATNPLAELQATYRGMFESAPEIATKTQCSYLARRDFFLRMQPDLQKKILPCAFSDEWLKRLNSSKVSLIFAAGYMNSAASSFGHTFLKLRNPENEGSKELLDYGVNFAARTADTQGALYALYGLTGFFPGNFAMMPYHQMIRDYTHLEGRDLWEYGLDFTPEEVRRMIYHWLELEKAYFDYYFLDDNCSFMILKALEVGRPSLDLIGDEEFFVIPSDTVKSIQPLVVKAHYRPSLETEWRQRKVKLSSDQRKRIFQSENDFSQIKNMDTETLSAAQVQVTLKELENRNRWKELSYQLARERARRGPESDDFRIHQPDSAPERAHDSSAVEIGYLEQPSKNLLLGFRTAFHDQMSRQTGMPPFSHLEVLGFQWQASDANALNLRRYRLLEMLSTQPISSFEKPLSWGAEVGADRDLEFETRLQHQAKGRIGYSYDLWPEKIRWANLLVAGTAQNADRDFQAVVGFNSRLWMFWTPRIRSSVQYEWLRFPSEDGTQTKVLQAFDLTDQLELRLGWQQESQGSRLRVDKTLFFVQNFLF